ncbi:MAG: 4'-phosphopantetheinyl transferase superfamily protein [Nitrococcus sp.]|nr:4'-phosphopantetheinyl transferase superfamily protein [Nitrococcus sp.]
MQELDAASVDVWRVSLSDPAWDEHCEAMSEEERLRSERFATERLRVRARRSRIALRCLLARYLGRPARELRFTYGAVGKPYMRDVDIHFNVSHSGDWALIGIGGHELGVDLEQIDRRGVNIAELVDLVCHPSEKERLRFSQTPAEHFYALWTQKEAYCKALGVGIGHPLTALRFESYLGSSYRVIDGERETKYVVRPVPAPKGFVAHVCVPRGVMRLGYADTRTIMCSPF